MRWRPRQQENDLESWPATYSYRPHRERSLELAEVLERLEVATRLRDADAAARLLERLTESEDGTWLLHQCAAAGLREVAARISDGAGAHASSGPPISGVRSIGVA